MTDKIDIINSMYSQLRISGVTVQPTSETLELALMRFEDMMAEYEKGNICLSYNFEDEPDPNSPTNVERWANHMMITNLAVRIIADFNKQVPQTLFAQASQSLSNASGVTAAETIRQVQAPRRMPRGHGNTIKWNRWARFQRPVPLAPNNSATNTLVIGDIDDYTEHFDAYLMFDETISSFTIAADPGLSLESSSLTSPDVFYRVKAVDNSTDGVFKQVKIVATTSLGRVETRIIDFNIKDNQTVGSLTQ